LLTSRTVSSGWANMQTTATLRSGSGRVIEVRLNRAKTKITAMEVNTSVTSR
jgi:hypothetical protein